MRHGRRRTDFGDMPLVKIAAVAGVIIVVIIALVFFLGGGSMDVPGVSSPSGGTPSSGPLKGDSIASVTVKETTAPSIPVTGVWVMIEYKGSFRGNIGLPTNLQFVEDSGARIYEVVNATGTVKALVEKKDSSTRWPLKVSIYKDGKLLKTGETSKSYGSVNISTDVGGSAVQEAVTTAEGTPVATTTS